MCPDSFRRIAFFGLVSRPPRFSDMAFGVGQPDNCATDVSLARPPFRPGESATSDARGVGHPPQSLTDVRCADARSRHIGDPAGISQSLQVSAYSGEPFPAILACNLLSKHRWRSALGDKAVKSGPEVSFVGMAFSLSCARKRLTWTASGPDGAVSPSGELEGEIPPGDAGEEMAAVESFNVISGDLLDASFVDFASHDVTGGDQVPQPGRGEWIVFVVVGGHRRFTSNSPGQ